MQEFFINRNSVNPLLEMELIKDGRYDYNKSLMNNALQDSDVFFYMRNTETGVLKVSRAKAEIVMASDESCEENYILRYRWKHRDTNTPGVYEGWFDIRFNGDIKEEGTEYPTGNLIVPIQENLLIYVK